MSLRFIKALQIIVGLILILLIIGVISGAQKHTELNSKIKEHCKPTELYIIGNKGRSSRVYDCSEKVLNRGGI